MIKRDFTIKGIDFKVADYRPRKNKFEKGLKYQLLIKIYDGSLTGTGEEDFYYRSTGYYFSTIKEAKQFANTNYYFWY